MKKRYTCDECGGEMRLITSFEIEGFTSLSEKGTEKLYQCTKCKSLDTITVW